MDHFDYVLQSIREEKAGLYRNYKYPNLIEVYKANNLHLAYFANVTDELVLASFRGEEELTAVEIWKVAHYNNIPLSVLTCSKLIMLDNSRRRHKDMVERLRGQLVPIQKAAQEGIKEAVDFMETYPRTHRMKVVNMCMDFINGSPVTYIRYLDTKKLIDGCLLSIKCERQRAKGPRGCRHD